jgi:hypothetical protein
MSLSYDRQVIRVKTSQILEKIMTNTSVTKPAPTKTPTPESKTEEVEPLDGYLMTQIKNSMPVREEASDFERDFAVYHARETVKSLAKDRVEAMLIGQMVAANAAAMECLKKASSPETKREHLEQNFKYATKFLDLYLKQFEALDRHRGRGQSTVAVEQVTVQPGGQAIVGNIRTGTDNAR